MSAFDAYGQSYGDVVQRSIAFSGLKHDLFLRAKAEVLRGLFAEHFGSVRPALLDVGCGIGALHSHLLPLCSDLSGCDPSADSLATARRGHPALVYEKSTGESLPWDAARFDVSLAVCVFHHVPADDRPRLLGEMARVTRPGGLVILIEHNPWNPLTRLAVARCPFDDDAVLLGARESRSLLARAGLSEIRSRYFLALPAVGRAASAIERPFRRIPLGAQYLAAGVV